MNSLNVRPTLYCQVAMFWTRVISCDTFQEGQSPETSRKIKRMKDHQMFQRVIEIVRGRLQENFAALIKIVSEDK